ncbi:MAG: trimethylamine methyltransferase family protein, partial [Candidatus Latescibacteria bacterium]|nr:trimethylamine methyltransferase family protein [Candidatus Latescibacterota bacterium]
MKPSTLSVLSDDECGRLIEAALEIVEKTGVLVTQPDVVDTLTGAGGSKGEDGRIRLTQANLRDLLSTAPGRFAMHDRAGGIIEIGSGRCWTMCGGTVAKVMAWPDWNLRQATREDAARFARLCDALPQSHCVVPVVEAQDVEPSHAEAISFAETLAHTTKFALACPVRHQSARAWVEMVRIATDKSDLSEHPTAGLLATLLPNLHLDDDCAATSVLAAREGMPLVCMAGSIAGSSGPNT